MNGLLRTGYTTGTCATLAAKAATMALLSGRFPSHSTVIVPIGQSITVAVHDSSICDAIATCTVYKDAGDDPDVTDGMPVCVCVRRTESPSITIDGGEGVGRVTLPGLDQPIGAAAINSVPRKMIESAVREVAKSFGCMDGFSVVVSLPLGKTLATKTFNSRLGIVGGLSILGTTGIVEPMSEQALVDSIAVHIRQKRALGFESLVVTPGNFGETFLSREAAGLAPYTVVCSNFIGNTLDSAALEGFSSVLIAGHAGKLTKIACNMMDTHSKYGDPRIVTIMAHAALCGASHSTVRELSRCATTDACMDVLYAEGLEMDTARSVVGKVSEHLLYRVGKRMQVGVLMFWGRPNRSVMDEKAREIIAHIFKETGHA